MSDKKMRLFEAERALQSLEIQIEQYCLHIEQLAGQPYEAEKARAVLEKIMTELASQRTYCELLKNAVPAEARAMNGARVA
jgi:hypothetical protein